MQFHSESAFCLGVIVLFGVASCSIGDAVHSFDHHMELPKNTYFVKCSFKKVMIYMNYIQRPQ